MPRIALPVTSGFYVSEANGFANVRLTNMYPIASPISTTGTALVHTPGITVGSDPSTSGSGSRGAINVGPFSYRVIGESFVLNGITIIGTIEGTSDVTMASNGINISIQVENGKNYFYDIGTFSLVENTDAVYLAYGSVKSVVEYRGYYLYNTSEVFFSGSFKDDNDGQNFNALDFEDAELNPDGIVRLFVNHDQLYVIGRVSTEIYGIITTSGFPFQRIPGATIQIGAFSVHCIAEFDNGFVMLGGDVNQRPTIVKIVGSSFARISDPSIEYIIAQQDGIRLDESRCFAYGENGAYFAVFSFQFDTLVFDSTTGAWHARQSGVGNGDQYFPWVAIHGLASGVDGSVQVGDTTRSFIGRLNKDVYTEYDDPIERIIPTIPFQDNASAVFNYEIELYMRTGLGNDDVTDPVIRFDYSDDNGVTFSSERWRNLGKIGQRGIRIRWSRVGRSPISRMLRWRVTDPVPVEIYALYGDIGA